jgi:hypothetical protein
MNQVLQHIEKDAPEYIALAGLFLVAVVVNMPTPDKFNNNIWYAWFYCSLQGFLAARSPHPIQPVEPAQHLKEK